jgi:hypothetical protein
MASASGISGGCQTTVSRCGTSFGPPSRETSTCSSSNQQVRVQEDLGLDLDFSGTRDQRRSKRREVRAEQVMKPGKDHLVRDLRRRGHEQHPVEQFVADSVAREPAKVVRGVGRGPDGNAQRHSHKVRPRRREPQERIGHNRTVAESLHHPFAASGVETKSRALETFGSPSPGSVDSGFRFSQGAR